MSKEYTKTRLAEIAALPAGHRKPVVKTRAEQLRRRREHALTGAPVPQERCDMCGVNPREAKRGHGSLCLDHDHATGAFRGWLCHNCNLGLGLIGDNLEAAERAVAYLKRVARAPKPPSKRLAGIVQAVKGTRE